MLNNHEYIARLIGGHNNGSLNENEQRELDEWMEASEANRSLFNELSDPDQIRDYLQQMEGYDEERGWEKIRSVHPLSDTPVRRLYPWKKIAIAASILLAVSLGGYFLLRDGKVSQETVTNVPDSNDVKAPEINRAVITLADGRTVALDSMNSGLLAEQATVSVSKTADGKIVYNGHTSTLIYNTLTNPRGSKVIDMTLADGSHVWLNAGSSVTYPVSFVGNERNVSITGEAYFEVAHDASKPFFVSKGDMNVQVLGTHFNVNAYEDENDIRVTLLEGSVKVSNKQESLIIKPNQQVVRRVNGDLSVVNNVNMEQVMAWKNGKFYFGNKADIQTIMRQIGRWYDVEVKYSGTLPKQEFGGEMPRSSSMAQVMEILKTSGLQFSIDGKSVTIGTK